MKKSKSIVKSPLSEVVVCLYKAAKNLSDSCYDNYGSESADSGYASQFYCEDAKEKLNKLLSEVEQNKRVKLN